MADNDATTIAFSNTILIATARAEMCGNGIGRRVIPKKYHFKNPNQI
jgi:hypothetical protein